RRQAMSERELHDPTLPDPDAPPSEEEVTASEALRRALEDAQAPSTPESELARALLAAHAPSALDEDAHRAMVDHALDCHEAHVRKRARRGQVIRVTFGGAGALAM